MNIAKQEQTGYWAQPHPGGQLLVIDNARVPTMSLPFAAISRNLKLKMTGCCLCFCKALHVGS